MAKQTSEGQSEFAKRVERLARRAARRKLDALVVLTEVNRLYLTGFHSSNAVLIVSPKGEALFYTDFRYLEMARKGVASARVRRMKGLTDLAPLAKRSKWRRVGYEGSISTTQLDSVRKTWPGVEDWVESEDLIGGLRVVKSRAEQAAIRRAVRLGDEVFRRTLEEVRPGMTEWDVRRVLRGWVDRLDAEGESFDCIVSAGSNGSKPHARVTRRVLRRGQPLLIDMGVRLGDYCSDMTRTVFLGEPSAKMREIYGVVLEAQQRALRAIRAGRTCKEIDAVARDYIAKRGYGSRFGHGLGHGVGLAIHEAPSLGAKSETALRPGMVVTVEPGVYLPGIGGVRIEDMVIVRREGCENLTRTPKELTILTQ